MKLLILIKGKSKQEKIVKYSDHWEISTTVPPVKNQVNLRIVELLAKEFNCPKTKIKLVHGHKSRYKIFEIED